MGKIGTFLGNLVDPLSLKGSDIDIRDIAHSLSLTNRYGGHSRVAYSVAQHCYLLWDYARSTGQSTELQKWALLHDASEAYLVDIPHPIKHHFWFTAEGEGPLDVGEYQLLEYQLDFAIRSKFNIQITGDELEWLKEMDRRICIDEYMTLMAGDLSWTDQAPLGITIRTDIVANHWEAYFLNTASNLGIDIPCD
jgi:uncharacterized protein